MADWTKSAKAALAKYLKAVKGSVDRKEADPDEVVEDIRQHFDDRVRDLKLSEVTDRDVTRMVKELGTPEPSGKDYTKRSAEPYADFLGATLAGIFTGIIAVIASYKIMVCGSDCYIKGWVYLQQFIPVIFGLFVGAGVGIANKSRRETIFAGVAGAIAGVIGPVTFLFVVWGLPVLFWSVQLFLVPVVGIALAIGLGKAWKSEPEEIFNAALAYALLGTAAFFAETYQSFVLVKSLDFMESQSDQVSLIYIVTSTLRYLTGGVFLGLGVSVARTASYRGVLSYDSVYTFWRRVAAFVLDIIFITVAAYAIAALFPGIPIIYLVISTATIYEGLMHSKLAGGRTVGKSVFGIKVVDDKGRPISLLKSIVRTQVLYWPVVIGFNALITVGALSTPFQWSMILALVAIVGTFLFNHGTRRSLHDFASGSHVVSVSTKGNLSAGNVLKRYHAGLSQKHKEVVLAVLVLLLAAVITVPRFEAMLDKAGEASMKGDLGAIKSACSIYYGDHEGRWPEHLSDLVPKYLEEIPADPEGNTKMVREYDGTGGWVYDSTKGNPSFNFETE